MNCANRFQKGSGIGFYVFPVDSERKQLWVLAISWDRWEPKLRIVSVANISLVDGLLRTQKISTTCQLSSKTEGDGVGRWQLTKSDKTGELKGRGCAKNEDK